MKMAARSQRIMQMCRKLSSDSAVSEAVNSEIVYATLENVPTTFSSENKVEEINANLEISDNSIQHLPSTSSFNEDGLKEILSSEFRSQNQDIHIVDYDMSSDEYDSDADPEFETQESSSCDEDAQDISTKKYRRWKQKNVENWKSFRAKKLRSECKPYVTKTGLKPAKAPKPVNCSTCRFKCTENFSHSDRISICKAYWELADFKRQKDFIIQHVKSETPKRRRVGSSKERVLSKQYYFNKSGNTYRVCAKFFEKTLSISNGPINFALAHVGLSGTFTANDRRGRKTPGNATSAENVALVKEHIESFPRMLPHYIRKSSKREYLESTLSILKMYSLYLELCKEREVTPVRCPIYRKIFCSQYNLSFFTPKKDQCMICEKYNSNKDDQTLQNTYNDHIKRKEEANKEKEKDKKKAIETKSFQTITYDLQSVLQLPTSNIGQLYYSRKLCVYNLAIYEGSKENKGYCFCWNEVHGQRGANEIGTSLLKYLENIDSSINHVTMFSDTCGGQNRNKHVAAALLFCVKNHPTLKVIEQKFLESGHSYMECDSMHSAIESAKKNKSLFIMNDWKEVFKSARSRRTTKKDPYTVMEFKYNDFFDLHDLSKETIKNKNRDEDGNIVNWLKVKCFKYEKENPDIIFYKYCYETDFKKIYVKRKERRPNTSVNLKQAYNNPLPISTLKKQDLVKLCNTGIIPEELQYWYRNLPSRGSVQEERAPEPAADEHISDESE